MFNTSLRYNFNSRQADNKIERTKKPVKKVKKKRKKKVKLTQ